MLYPFLSDGWRTDLKILQNQPALPSKVLFVLTYTERT